MTQGSVSGEQKAGRVCVYTTLIGGYEALNEQPVAHASQLPFICLTDDPNLRSATWEIRPVQTLFGMDPIRSQRLLKLRPRGYLPEFDRSLYIDNSVILKVAPDELIESYAKSPFCLPEHGYRDNVLDEFMEVEATGLDDQSRIFEQLSHYMLERPEVLEEKPYWTAILLRDHRDQTVRDMLEVWWAHVQRYSRRDQLSVNFAFRQAGLEPDTLRIDNFDSWFHSWPYRENSQRKNTIRHTRALASSPIVRIRDLEKQTDALGARAAELEQSLAEQQRETETARAELATARASLADQQRRSKALEAAKAAAAQSMAELRLQNREMLTSTSWRATAPIRNAVDHLRGLKQKARRALRRRPMSTVPQSPEMAAFLAEGFIGPVDVFTRAQCDLILKHCKFGPHTENTAWHKGRAVRDRLFFDLATRPKILERLRPLLGDDIVLWGANIVRRGPGKAHPWHTDVESFAADGACVSVWIGLENTSRDSALQLISRSHRFGKTIQQDIHERGFVRGDASDERAAAWAREHDKKAVLVRPEMRNGQALFFDGRLWHGSYNNGKGARTALLLQYAAAGTQVNIPVHGYFDWPFRFTDEAAPSVVVSGTARNGRIVPPPSACPPQHSAPVVTNVHGGEGLDESDKGWKPYPMFRGPTPILPAMGSHVSVLSPGHSPHMPHSHIEEELLVVLEGEAEIVIADSPDPAGARVERLSAGSFVYYPAYQHHTIRNVSSAPVTYLMYKWQGAPIEVEQPLETSIFAMGEPPAFGNGKTRAMRHLFEAPTAYLGKLHAHTTHMQPGAGYPAHEDPYDVGIIVFSGVVETLGKRIGPRGSVFYAAGEPHGLRNVGNEAAHYLVLEFHGAKTPPNGAGG